MGKSVKIGHSRTRVVFKGEEFDQRVFKEEYTNHRWGDGHLLCGNYRSIQGVP